MSVYVDALAMRGRWRWGKSCHMVADTLEELHAMAARIGHKREWFQDVESAPHYDLAANARERAVKAGAIEVDRAAFVAVIRRLRHPTTREGPDPMSTPIKGLVKAAESVQRGLVEGASRGPLYKELMDALAALKAWRPSEDVEWVGRVAGVLVAQMSDVSGDDLGPHEAGIYADVARAVLRLLDAELGGR